MSDRLPTLEPWQPTRRSLHAWSKVLSAVRGALVEKHPHWWHISLRVDDNGLTTGAMAAGEVTGGIELRLDLERHSLVVAAGGAADSLELGAAPAASEAGAWALERVAAALGREPVTARDKWHDPAERGYDAPAAERYGAAVATVAAVLGEVRAELPGERGPVQLWAHHFDLAFEVFGRRRVESEEAADGEQPAQIGFGFFPGDDDGPAPYFYGTPWPFDETMRDAPLPAGRWRTEGWEGAELPYAAVVEAGTGLLRDFCRAVWEGGRSTLD